MILIALIIRTLPLQYINSDWHKKTDFLNLELVFISGFLAYLCLVLNDLFKNKIYKNISFEIGNERHYIKKRTFDYLVADAVDFLLVNKMQRTSLKDSYADEHLVLKLK